MKTIAVILPINNPDILTQADLESYQTATTFFQLHYVDTTLKELNTSEDVAAVLRLVIDKTQEVVNKGAVAVIVFAFGELGVQENKQLVNVPVMALGTEAIKQASQLSKKKFTILPGMHIHNEFLQAMVQSENLTHNYSQAMAAPEVTFKLVKKL